jgi:5'-nucleotidase
MKILISNDDGVYADGLKELENKLREIADVISVAPLEERSTTGHTLTLEHPLRLKEVRPNSYGCSGYPADCVHIGVRHLMSNVKPDLVVSGINRGANLGQDTYYSGTCAAAREAAFMGIPSIAISSVIDFVDVEKVGIKYETAATFIRDFITKGGHQNITEMSILNINVPNLDLDKIKGTQITTLGRRVYSGNIDRRLDSRSNEYFWIGGALEGSQSIEGSDCNAVAEGKISITPINLINKLTDNSSTWTRWCKDHLA